MRQAQFADPQFVDAVGPGGLNAAFGAVSGSFTSVASGAWAGAGLIAPEVMTVGFTGMVGSVGLPAPWAVLSSGGILVRAHGTVNNQETTSYPGLSFTSLVPASGSRTAYVVATISTIQQSPVPIPGPPQGHPSYDPNFIPTVGYALLVYTTTLSAVTGVPDNLTNFELLRTTLSAGQVNITTWDTRFQVRASNRKTSPAQALTVGGVLTPDQAQSVLAPSVAGLTHTLPLVASAGGLTYCLANPTVGNWTLSTQGTDRIIGAMLASGTASLILPPSGSVMLYGNAVSGVWHRMGGSNDAAVGGIQVFATNGTFTFTVPAQVTAVDVECWGGGGGSSGGIGGGGGGGGYCFKHLSGLVPGTNVTVTVAAGGIAGSNGSGSTTGGTSSFGAFCSATGGAPGTSGTGPGGGGVGGDINISGGPGQDLDANSTYALGAVGFAFGGASPKGGMPGTVNSAGTFLPPTAPGGGGSANATSAGGQAGAIGMVVVRW